MGKNTNIDDHIARAVGLLEVSPSLVLFYYYFLFASTGIIWLNNCVVGSRNAFHCYPYTIARSASTCIRSLPRCQAVCPMSSLFPSPHLTSSHTICSFSLYSFRHHENLSDLHQYIIEDTPPFPPNQQQSTRPGPRVINLDDESMYVLPHISFIPKYSSFSLMCTLLFPPLTQTPHLPDHHPRVPPCPHLPPKDVNSPRQKPKLKPNHRKSHEAHLKIW